MSASRRARESDVEVVRPQDREENKPLLGRKSMLVGMLTSGFVVANAATANAGTVKPGTIAAAQNAYVLRWAPATAYVFGQQVTNPNNDVATANVGHTSSSAYATDTAKWTLSATCASKATEVTVTSGRLSDASLVAQFGSGSSGARLDSVPVNVKACGAVGNGVSGTADTAGVKAAIALVQGAPTVGITGGRIIFPPGEYVITQTINLTRFSGEIAGAGIGNPPNYSPSPGQGTVLRWAGPAGAPIFLVRDSAMVTFTGLRIEGSDTAIPSYLIESRHTSGEGAGTNAQLCVEKCALGIWPWSSQGLNKGKAAVGIGFTGDNGDNDQFHISDTVIQGCPVGLDLPNSQSIWGNITDSMFANCITAGIRTNASLDANNIQFDDCAVDIKTYGSYSSARINVHGWYSERAQRIFDATTSLAALNVFGGLWTLGGGGAMTGDAFLNHANVTGGGQVNLQGATIVNQLGAWPNIVATGAGGGTTGLFRMVGCVHAGMTTADLIITNGVGNSNGVNVVIDDAEIQTRQWLGSGVALKGGLVTSHLPS